MSKLDPTAKAGLHGSFVNFLIVVSSAIGSFLFVFSVYFGSVFYHLRDLASGREKANKPRKENASANYIPVEPYPDLKKLKVTRDLKYYAQLLGFDLEERTITTKDGYILVLHRLVDSAESAEDREKRKPILLQHGLLSCSGAWLTPGRNSLAYYFMHQGYDVWMGNNRCGFRPQHSQLKGNLMHNERFWDWDVRHLAFYDLPCIIDNVLSHKPSHSRLILVGHSQGCTQSLLLLRNEKLKEHQAKIEHFFALAPAAFPGSLFHDRRFIKFIHSKSPRMYKLIFGNCCFLAIMTQARNLIGTTRIFSLMSYQIFKYLFGWSIRNCYSNDKVIHVQFLFNVSLVSSELMSWWLSYSVEEGFSNQLLPKEMYNDGSNSSFTPVNSAAAASESQNHDLEKNAPVEEEEKQRKELEDSKTLFPYKSEWFAHASKEEIVPMMIFTGGEDFLVDGSRFATHMTHYEHNYYQMGGNLDVIEIEDYNHLDVIWASNCIGKIGMPIVERLQSLQNLPAKSESTDA